MSKNYPKIMSLTAALAALTGAAIAVSDKAEANIGSPNESTSFNARPSSDLMPNRIVSVGEDFLGFIVTEASDGTMLAQHYSHYSHSSHASHASHYSSRR